MTKETENKNKIRELEEKFNAVVPENKRDYWKQRVNNVKSLDRKIEILEGCIKHFGGQAEPVQEAQS